MQVSTNHVGLLIGRGGSVIKELKRRVAPSSDIHILRQTEGSLFTTVEFVGTKEGWDIATSLISRIIQEQSPSFLVGDDAPTSYYQRYGANVKQVGQKQFQRHKEMQQGPYRFPSSMGPHKNSMDQHNPQLNGQQQQYRHGTGVTQGAYTPNRYTRRKRGAAAGQAQQPQIEPYIQQSTNHRSAPEGFTAGYSSAPRGYRAQIGYSSTPPGYSSTPPSYQDAMNGMVGINLYGQPIYEQQVAGAQDRPMESAHERYERFKREKDARGGR